jgi:hydrophobe/amphiphile efflux-1 (HAE1) family protein
MAKLFINRPVLAMVMAIVITLLGAISYFILPRGQYPEIVPPQVKVSCTFRGASAEDVEKTVAQPIEQQLIGLDGLLYFSSNSANDGSYTMYVTYELGTDIDLATVKTQNKVNIALPLLPEEVKREGVTVQKVSSAILLAVGLYSPDGRYDDLFLGNYVTINFLQRIGTLPGVGDARLGSVRDYGMRVWVNPDKMTKLGLTATDVKNAISEQNRQNPAGQLGQPPIPQGTDFQYPVNAGGRLLEADEFSNIILRAKEDGSILRVKDIGRVELGAVDYRTFSRINGKPGALILIYLAPGANAIATRDAVVNLMEEQKKNFPAGIEYAISYDTTDFVRASLEDVVHTFFEALILVIIVVFVFLQNWRATLIPLLTVPVSIVGTFALFPALGFTVNTISMFGLVLAIGIVVDDAIVVVEAVQHHIDHGMSPKEATFKAMEEVSGPVVAIAFILAAVFVPVAFMGGISGTIYRQFALTIAVSVLLSAVSALTLSPALSALLLKPASGSRGPLARFYNWFNRVFGWTTDRYMLGARLLIRRFVLALVILLFFFIGTYGLFKITPGGFLPFEDQGAFFVMVRLPDGASLERNDAVLKRAEEILLNTHGIKFVNTIGGFDLINNINNMNISSFIVALEPWEERHTSELHIESIIEKVQQQFNGIESGMVLAVNMPPILGLGNGGGFEFFVEDKAGRDIDDLYNATQEMIVTASQRPELTRLYTPLRVTVPQVRVDLDQDKAKTRGIPLTNVYDTLQTFLGGLYVNDFNAFGRTWKVMMQSEPEFRRTPDDIKSFYVRAGDETMVPLSTLVTEGTGSGPEVVYRYNSFRAAKISGDIKPGYSSGQGNAAMEETAARVLPSGFGYEWTGTVYQQKKSEGKEAFIFGLAGLLVLLFLAALYESWSIPFAVLLSVPIGIFGAMLGLWATGLTYDVYAQIGIVTLIGLAAKNAILIVEFAKMRREEGLGVVDAATEAAQLRLRPILMTSFAFILGCIPLVIAAGAGAGARNALGTGVVWGMTIATCIGIFIVPTLYVLIQGTTERFFRKAKQPVEVKTRKASVEGPSHAGD